MAHHTHDLPWQAVADHFKFVYKNQAYENRTNLYPCFKRGQGEQLQDFCRVFASLMDNASAQERTHYPRLTPPEDDEIFITDDMVKRTAKTVAHYKQGYEKIPSLSLSEEERKVPFFRKAFYALRRAWPARECCQSLDFLKTLILFDDIQPLLRLAVVPDVEFPHLYAFPEYTSPQHGWNDIKHSALIAYVGLNMFFAKPELYDPTARAHKLEEMVEKYGLSYTPDMFDYRNTFAYQKVLTHVTYARWESDFDVCPLPHREFFGIENGMITTRPGSHLLESRLGLVPPSQLLDARYRSWYVPTSSDVSTVRSFLATRLPTELALEVLEHADYTAKRRIPIANDPLHAQNTEVLEKYMADCWRTLVRIDMLVKAHGWWIDWEYEITEVIYELFGVPGPREMSSKIFASHYEGKKEGEIDPWRTRRTFV
jgi:hypothetical protein